MYTDFDFEYYIKTLDSSNEEIVNIIIYQKSKKIKRYRKD